MNTSYNIPILLKSAGILLAGILLGWLLFGGSQPQTSDMEQHIEDTHTNQQGEIVYTCSMHPSVRQNEPGDCPICGMELIPANQVDSESTDDQHPQALRMTKAAMQLADVQTMEVTSKKATKEVQMPGKVTIDERAISIIPAHFPGRIEKLHLNFTGAYVEKGDKLATVYSPELVTAQRELLEAYKRRESNPRLYESTRQKFINWEIAPEVIDRILENGQPQENFVIYSHKNGYVTERHIAVGDHIHFGKPIFEIADLSSVWIKFDVYESDLQGLSVGDNIRFSVTTYPGETFESEVTYINPLIDENERTATIRTEFANNDEQLKPNMLAEGTVNTELNGGQATLQIPKQAVLWTGERSIAYVKLPDTSQTRFEAREIELGTRAGDHYIVKNGLEPGEQVVIRGNFMIDSAAQLADKKSMMNPNPGQGGMPAGHNHGEMESGSTELESTGNSSRNEHNPEVSSEAQQDTTQHQHPEHLSALISHYLMMKNALTNDDFDEAQKHLDKVKTEVTESVSMNDHPEHSQMHKEHHAAMVQAVEKASDAQNIDMLREAFIPLSENLLMAVENQGYDEQQLYLQYCPMANDGDGARWLSKEKKIRNPFYGQQMHDCGETVESIN